MMDVEEQCLINDTEADKELITAERSKNEGGDTMRPAPLLPGSVHPYKVMRWLQDLEIRGNLKIPMPTKVEQVEELLKNYDPKLTGKLERDGWSDFVADVVIDPVDFTGQTIEKVAFDLHLLRLQMLRLEEKVDQMSSRSEQQIAELFVLLGGDANSLASNPAQPMPPPTNGGAASSANLMA